MGKAKEIRLEVIKSSDANAFVKKWHYSGKVVNNSTLHLGAFLDGKLHGVMSFGNPIDKRKVLPLVHTADGVQVLWNEMLELNRMAFDDVLPKNSESRCIAIAMKLIRKNAPHIKWVLSFSDGTQCGDGTIYRASGFVLTGVKMNTAIYVDKKGKSYATPTFSKAKYNLQNNGKASSKNILEKLGASKASGYQLRYIYLIDKTCKITVPILPFSEIDKLGAGMYKGKKISLAERKALSGGVVTNPASDLD